MSPSAALTKFLANRCEQALDHVCHCRCGGMFHGRKAVKGDDGSFFWDLPSDDPHYVPLTKSQVRQLLRHAEDYLIRDYRDDDWSTRQRARYMLENVRRNLGSTKVPA